MKEVLQETANLISQMLELTPTEQITIIIGDEN